MTDPIPLNGISVFPQLSNEFIKKNYPSERVPISRRFENISPVTWDFCKNANVLHSEFRKSLARASSVYHLSTDSPLDVNSDANEKKEYWKTYREERVFPSHLPAGQRVGAGGSVSTNKAGVNDKYYDNANPSTCGWGQLSDVGWITMLKTGQYLRNLYVDKLSFLPQNPQDIKDDELLFRTTDYSRAFESLHQVISGLYPIKKIDDLATKKKFNVLIRTIHNETLFLNYRCKNLKNQILKMHEKSLGIFKDEQKSVEKMLYDSPNIGAEAHDILNTPNVPIQFHSVYDTLVALEAHNISVPPEISAEGVERVGLLAAKQWSFSGVFNQQLGRLQFSPIGLDLVNNIVTKIDPNLHYKIFSDNDLLPVQKTPSFAIYSGHDTTIVPILGALGYYRQDGTNDPLKFLAVWPQFGSMVSIELFKGPVLKEKNKNSEGTKKWPSTVPSDFNPDGYYVRSSFNGKPIAVPKCSESGNHDPDMGPTMCTLDAFLQQLGPLVETTQEWKTECRA
ncbi:putative acid phosphatase [Smittium mucronatum]|uniref:Putative acid phosphatase n=1 Tax=Smittium mucronatum TaxID=133383 RepID=A0A1R0H1Z2_9FUNG|nr:putative acid phosphatase [Smittium mucronatum]